MNLIDIIVCVILLLNSCFGNEDGSECLTKTVYGISEGKLMTSTGGQKFCAFFGIPYASAPIGSLRFLPPISPQKWNGTKVFKDERTFCLQVIPGGSEDCLVLNIFTHSTDERTMLAVMVHIHGGGFHMGSMSTRVLGPENFMDKDIVLVTIQYRLGLFGFLSTGDEIVPGNMGLKDQVKALEWIKENIKHFGGDPERITLFGSSAGAAAVHLHMQSPKSKHLFKRAISQSGTGLSSFAMTTKDKARKDMEDLAKALNCSIMDSLDTLTCLQNKSSDNLLEVFKHQISSDIGYKKLFRPVIEVETEHAFITSSPFQAITDKQWLVGVNANEGIFRLETRLLNKTLQSIKTDFQNFGPLIMFIDDLYKNLEAIANSTFSLYFKNALSDEEIMRGFEQMISDSWFVWPTEKAISKHNGTLFYYLYDHHAEHSFAEIYNCVLGLGVSHMDELLALFTQKPYFKQLNERDKRVSELMIDLWVNFAKEGNPTPQPINRYVQTTSSKDFVWEDSASNNPKYIHIQTENLSMQTSLFKNRMAFWRQLNLEFK